MLGENPKSPRSLVCAKCGNVEIFQGKLAQEPVAIQQVVPFQAIPYPAAAPTTRTTWLPSVKGILDSMLASALLVVAAFLIGWIIYTINQSRLAPAAPGSADETENGK